MSKITLLSARNTTERGVILNNLFRKLSRTLSDDIQIEMFANKIEVYHNELDVDKHLRSIIHTYIIVIIPINIDLSVLAGWSGEIEYKLERTINQVVNVLNILKKLQGEKQLEENTYVTTLEQLAGILS